MGFSFYIYALPDQANRIILDSRNRLFTAWGYVRWDTGYYSIRFLSYQLSFLHQIFHCWNDKGHGFVNCSQAIAVSCDCYFYDLSLRVGIDNIYETAKKFGFGDAFLDDIFNPSEGIVPSRKWKKKQYEDIAYFEPYYLKDFYINKTN